VEHPIDLVVPAAHSDDLIQLLIAERLKKFQCKCLTNTPVRTGGACVEVNASFALFVSLQTCSASSLQSPELFIT
jgi:hypothetical protein